MAAVSSGLGVLTVAKPEWIEAATGLTPDGGSKTAEWVVAGIFLLVALAAAFAARANNQRLADEDEQP